MIYDLSFLTDFALLALRLVVATVFFSSGRQHAQNPVARGKSIGMPTNVTFMLGVLQIIASVSIAFGIVIQVGAGVIIFVMMGAIYKKVFEWNKGFYAKEGLGWHYDLIFLAISFVFLTLGGGRYILLS